MKVDLNGKVAIVTGAGGAIGDAIAKRFSENGASVAVCDINVNAGQKIADEITNTGGKAKFFKLDVSDRSIIPTVFNEIVKEFGKIDILVNNAGVNVGGEDRVNITDFSDEKWDWICKIDLEGVYNCSKKVIPHIIKAGGGTIINISSVVGMVPFRNQCAFAAAKAGVINLSKAMALELAPNNIRVNCICPGSILSEGTKDLFYGDPQKAEAIMSHIPQHRPGCPDDIAYGVLYLVSAQAGYVTGSVLTIDGGWTCGYARDF